MANPNGLPIQEYDRTIPTNAYGETKLAMENMIRWFGQAHGIRGISLRYFNAAGAHESGRIGEDHQPENASDPDHFASGAWTARTCFDIRR